MATTDLTHTTRQPGPRRGAGGGSRPPAAGAKPLVIVESPAKAKTIAGLLGSDYVVESSIGHIRDLPRRATRSPPPTRGRRGPAWGSMSTTGSPLYVVSTEKKSQVAKLKQLVKEASEVYLASDEDREGESIAWHLLEVLAPQVPVKRMVFHEITRPAIERAVLEWRDLDRRLVDAQEARRILDRLYGYELGPSCGRRSCPGCRPDGSRAWPPAWWWSGSGPAWCSDRPGGGGSTPPSPPPAHRWPRALPARSPLLWPRWTGWPWPRAAISTGRNLASTDPVVVLGEEEARALAAGLADVPFAVTAMTHKPFRRSPAAPS